MRDWLITEANQLAQVFDNASVAEAKQAVADKYGWQAALARLADNVRDELGRGDAPVAIRIALDEG